ncbi:hypothetical protein [Streptomyces sp. YIM 98790]|uniref:hypothetical protein n=1 Tax=Streptomyces sp. YIM 98790 TaxID=2689077 RepID=UPI00140A0D22|nr:hypothetical protein [Streptomyces sp. YIM 98790]
MTVPPDSVISAWQNMQDWVENQLPGLAQAAKVPDDNQDVGDIGACDALNQGRGGSSGTWESDGDAHLQLSSLRIASLSQVSIQTATAVDDSTVQLPFGFSCLEVDGNYWYGEPCAYYDWGKKSTTGTADGQGTITQAIDNSSLYYVAKLSDTVTLDSVTVNGTPRVNMTPDTGGMPSWIAALVEFLSTGTQLERVRTNMQNTFLRADFATTMLTLLKQKIGG